MIYGDLSSVSNGSRQGINEERMRVDKVVLSCASWSSPVVLCPRRWTRWHPKPLRYVLSVAGSRPQVMPLSTKTLVPDYQPLR